MREKYTNNSNKKMMVSDCHIIIVQLLIELLLATKFI